MRKFIIYPLIALLTGLLLFSFVRAQTTFNRDLYFGLRNDGDVSMLQEFLSDQGLYSGPISGNFFSLTLRGVQGFQSREGIRPASGYFGPLSRARANAILQTQIPPSEQATPTPVPFAPTPWPFVTLPPAVTAYPSPLACTDSDGGRNFYEKGTLVYGGLSYVDGCTYCSGFCLPGQPCSTACGAVTEYYCDNNGVKSEVFICLNGCADGACKAVVSTPTPVSTPVAGCSDSDGGKNYFVKGAASTVYSRQTDVCTYCSGYCPPSSSCVPYCGAVVEYFCVNDQIQAETYICRSGCYDGACLSVAASPVPTPMATLGPPLYYSPTPAFLPWPTQTVTPAPVPQGQSWNRTANTAVITIGFYYSEYTIDRLEARELTDDVAVSTTLTDSQKWDRGIPVNYPTFSVIPIDAAGYAQRFQLTISNIYSDRYYMIAYDLIDTLGNRLVRASRILIPKNLSGSQYYGPSPLPTVLPTPTPTVTTIPIPTTIVVPPPVISNIQVVNVTTNSATIAWTTDKAANSKVSYATDGVALVLSPVVVADQGFIYNHSINLTGLAPNTKYYYSVFSVDPSGASGMIGGLSFMTLSSVTGWTNTRIASFFIGAYAQEPSLAWNGQSYGIVWHGKKNTKTEEIFFTSVDVSGRRLGDDVRLTNHDFLAAAIQAVSAPEIVWNGSKYGLAWVSDEGYGNVLHFAIADRNGAKLSDVVVTLPSENAVAARPALIWTGNEFALAWSGGWPYYPLYFAKIASDGQTYTVNKKQPISAANAQSAAAVSIVSLAYAGSDFGLAWLDIRDSRDAYKPALYFAVLDSNGNKKAGDVMISSGIDASPNVLYDGAYYGLFWKENALLNNTVINSIYFAKLDGQANKVIQNLNLNVRGDSELLPNVALANNRYGIVWTSYAYPNPDLPLYFKETDLNGVTTIGDQLVSSVPGLSESANIVWNGLKYAVAWSNDGQLYFGLK